MDEELVQNVAMDEELVQNVATGAKIDPKVEMDLSMFEIDGWKILQPSNRKLLEESNEEAATVALLIETPSRDSFLVMHYVKELTLPREGLRETMQCYKRQHFAAGNELHEHPGGHSSGRESTRMKFMNILEYSKMRSESSEYMWKTRSIFYLDSLGELLRKTCTGSLGETLDES